MACPHRTRLCRPLQRGSSSTNARRAYLPSRHWSTGRIGLRRVPPPVHHCPCASIETLPPLTSTTTTPTPGMRTTTSSSWSFSADVRRRFGTRTVSSLTVRHSCSHTTRSDSCANRGVPPTALTMRQTLTADGDAPEAPREHRRSCDPCAPKTYVVCTSAFPRHGRNLEMRNLGGRGAPCASRESPGTGAGARLGLPRPGVDGR